MSFYVIKDKGYNDTSFAVDLEVGIFDEDGIKEAKPLLVEKCKKIIQERIDSRNSILIPHKNERDTILEIRNYYKSIGKEKPYMEERLKDLDKKIKSEELDVIGWRRALDSNNADNIIGMAGYDIVEVPVLSHCDKDILWEFL